MGEEEEEPLSPAARVFQAPALSCCVVSIVGCKTKINPEVVIKGMKETVVKHPARFSSKLADGFEKRGRWIRTDVNVEDHVTVPDLDQDEIGDPDQFIEDYVAHLTKIPLDTSRPLWDIHILNVKTSEAEAVFVARTHHSLGDGVSLMSLVLAYTRKTSDPEALPSVPGLKRRKRPDGNSEGNQQHGFLRKTLDLEALLSVPGLRQRKLPDGYSDRNQQHWFLRLVRAVWSVVRLVWNTVEDVVLFSATALFLKDTETFVKGGANTGHNLKRFAHRTVSLDDIRLIKNAMNMTINDVLLGVTQAAISRYLSRKNEEVGVAAGNLKNQLGRIRLRATVLVNLRPESGVQPLEDMMAKGSNCRWGNCINYIILPFSIGLQNNPLDYLLKAKSAMDRKKHSLQAALMYSCCGLGIHLFGIKMLAALTHRAFSNTTMSISNVVGPVEEISFLGHPIAFFAPSVYGHPQALTVHFMSYADKMTISIAVDPTVIPDPHELCDEMEESLNTIKAAVEERGLNKHVN